MSNTFFLSDVHLGTGTDIEETEKKRRLLSLLGEIGSSHSGALYIVGDLFDFWFEYAHVLPRGHHDVLSALGTLVSNGTPVTYLAGNHDFAIGSFFSRDLGITVVHDDLDCTVQNHRFYLVHGDGLSKNDRGYRILKKILRNRAAQGCFRLLHPDMGFRLARLVSHTSRDYTGSKNFGPGDSLRNEAARRIAMGTDYVVMGHRHLPVIEQIGSGAYVNLGDWLTHFTYAVFNGSTMNLFTLQNDKHELYPIAS